MPCRGLAHHEYPGDGHAEGSEQQPPHQMSRRGPVLDQRTGAERACGQAEDGGCGVDDRREPAAAGLQVDQSRAERPGRCADGDALQHAGGE
jgi:hypothetical protein